MTRLTVKKIHREQIKLRNAFINKIASIIPSGYAGLILRIITVKAPTKKPKIHLPKSVCAPVTGSVAIKTVPKRKLPITK